MSDRNSFIESTKETDERLQALMRLYPEIFSDGKINLDAFKDVTGASDLPEGADKTPGYYGLYWPGKRGAKQLARKEAEGTLEPVAGEGVSEDTTHNIYIEGDNLEVLRILKQSYKARVKMIYIDPPYNTGNDFIYPDDYKMPVEEYLKMTGQKDEGGKRLVSNTKSGGAFHTNWLNMMYPRLQLARELLTEDGVIFISIDDNEQANLKLLCDDVFGEENFISSICHKARASVSNDRIISENHNSLIFYAKNMDILFSFHRKIGDDPVLDGFNHKDENGFYKLTPVDGPGGAKKGNPYYEFLGVSGYWRYSKETMQEKYDAGLIVRTQNNLQQKYYLSQAENSRKTVTTWWDDNFLTSTATTEFVKLMGGKYFDNPKNVNLILRCAKMITKFDKDSIILDFFSGSATTAHAVMQLNAEDGGHRKFIMVQLPHACDENSEAYKAGYKNICEIGKERIRRAGAKILEEAKANKDMFTEDAPLDTGFKVFRLQKSNFVKYTPVHGQDEAAKASLFDALEGSLVPLAQGWKQENVLTEIILRQGFALDCKKERLEGFKENAVWKITDSPDAVSKKITLYVCLDDSISGETIKTLALGDDEKFVCMDSTIDDSNYARLSDKGRIETI